MHAPRLAALASGKGLAGACLITHRARLDTPVTNGSSIEMTSLSQRKIEGAWLATNVAYAVFRILLARQFLAEHGLNIWGFAVVEAVSSIGWALASARLVRAVIARRLGAGIGWAALATVGFFAPDAYVLGTTHEVPAWLYIVIGAWMTVATVIGAVRLIGAIRGRGGAAEPPRTPAPSPPSPR